MTLITNHKCDFLPVIPNTTNSTSVHGFGTSGLMGSALTDRGRIDLLNYAYDQGVSHFDTAPLYGMGKAEQVLGEFIKDKRIQVTITTKYGLEPDTVPGYLDPLVSVGRYLNRRSKLIHKLVEKVRGRNVSSAHHSTDSSQTPTSDDYKNQFYDTADLKSKLDHSLKELKTDYIDVYLLHECKASCLNEEVVQCLNDLVESGKVLSYGLATSKSQASHILDQFPQLEGVVQVPNSIISAELSKISSINNLLTITHSVFADVWNKVNAFLLEDQQHVKDWSQALNHDLSKAKSLSELLFAQALYENKDGIVLFSSADKKNIKSNCKIADGHQFTGVQLDKFKNLIQQQVFKMQ